MNSTFQFHDLKGRCLLVTGVTRGIGRALLRPLLEQGLNLILLSRGIDRLQVIQEELGFGHDRIQCYDCDLSDEAATTEVARKILDSGVSLDGMLHNAGVDTREHFEKADGRFWQEIFQVNLFSAVTLTRMLLPVLRQSSQGRIIYTGSVMFGLGSACLTTYVATKGALVGLTRSLAHELQGSGITVNCVVPGAIQVEKEARVIKSNEAILGWQSTPRRLEPADLAGLICLLLSQAGAGINGQDITVDGGIVHPLASREIQGRRLNPNHSTQ